MSVIVIATSSQVRERGRQDHSKVLRQELVGIVDQADLRVQDRYLEVRRQTLTNGKEQLKHSPDGVNIAI